MVLAMYVDGSYLSKYDPSGYGLTFRRVAPGTRQNGMLVKMKWRIEDSSILKIQGVETVAFLEAVRRAKIEAVDFVAKRLPVLGVLAGTGTRRPKITIKIFSDNKRMLWMLRHAQDGDFSLPDTDDDRIDLRLVQEIVEATHDLYQTLKEWGLESDLQGHWCPAHTGAVDTHTLVDQLAKDARLNPGCYAWLGRRRIRPCPLSVYAALERELHTLYNSLPVVTRRSSRNDSTGPSATRVGASSPEPPLPAVGWDTAFTVAWQVYGNFTSRAHRFGSGQEYVFVCEGSGTMWRISLIHLRRYSMVEWR